MFLPFQTLSSIEARAFIEKNKPNLFLMDVRKPSEFEKGHLENAVNIPVDTIPARIEEIPKNKILVIYCEHGSRSKLASAYLVNHDYKQVFHIEGGFSELS